MTSLLRPSQVADDLNVSRYTVYALIRRGELETARVGHQIRIPAAALADYRARKLRSSVEPSRSAPLEVVGLHLRAVLSVPDDLLGLPVTTQLVVQSGRGGARRSSVRGVLVHTLLSTLGLLPEGDPLAPAGHSACQPIVTAFVRAVGQDGRSAVFSLAEISPEYGRVPVMIAFERDGVPIAEGGPACIVVPTDSLAGRNIRGISQSSSGKSDD